MIFIIMESMMNGTVTLSVSPTGIEAEDFEQAKTKLKSLENIKKYATITFDGDTLIEYKMESTPPVCLYGRMGATPLPMIGDKV